MSDTPAFTPTELRVLTALEVGGVVPQSQLSLAMCGWDDIWTRANVRSVLTHLRNKGVEVTAARGEGYQLGRRKRCEACGGKGLQ